jgi:hypothetical protein
MLARRSRVATRPGLVLLVVLIAIVSALSVSASAGRVPDGRAAANAAASASLLPNGYQWVGDRTSGTLEGIVGFDVEFDESGLRPGTTWSVDLAGQTNVTSNNSLGFVEPNGKYAFEALPVSGYSPTPAFGNITVEGRAPPVTPIDYLVAPAPPPFGHYDANFTESGLPAGTSWSITFNRTAQLSSTTDLIVANATNGTYPFSVGSVSGYVANITGGLVTIRGHAVSTAITFTPSSGSSPPASGSGGSSNTPLLIVAVVVVLAAAAGAGAALYLRSKKHRTGGSPPSRGNPPPPTGERPPADAG